MGQIEFSLFLIKNMFFLVVGDRVICYNDHGYIPMVSVITRLAGGCHWDLFQDPVSIPITPLRNHNLITHPPLILQISPYFSRFLAESPILC